MKLCTARENGKLFDDLLASGSIDDEMRRTLNDWIGLNKPIVAELTACEARTIGLKDKLTNVGVGGDVRIPSRAVRIRSLECDDPASATRQRFIAGTQISSGH